MNGFTGQVDFDVYFGTKYDSINVPYDTQQIINDATKVIHATGNVVWQTTWLSTLRVNVVDYQDIVGAQYVRITDTGATSHGDHWFTVVGYNQISKCTAELGLAYDPLLTIGISNIKNISGMLTRWTVATDSVTDYIMTPEPVDQTRPYKYSFYNINPVTSTSTTVNLLGTNVNLDTAPEIVQYENPDGETTSIYYPKMEYATPTTYSSKYPNGSTKVSFDTGMAFYLWNSETVKQNYDACIGLAYDISTVGYKLPVSSLYSMTYDGNKVTNIDGTTKTDTTACSCYNSGQHKNQKTRGMGVFFTLTNPVSGESVTVRNYDITMTGNVVVMTVCDPSPEGRFYARIQGYLTQSTGGLGWVASPGWSPLNVSSRVGAGSTLNAINNNFALRSVGVQETNAKTTATAGLVSGLLNTAGNVGAQVMSTSNPISALTGETSNRATLLSATAQTAGNVLQYATQLDNINRASALQREQLSVTGTISTNTPPAIKYSNLPAYTNYAYTFYLIRQYLNSADISMIDRFFTAYGYNVGRTALNDVSQLACRERFTFVQADDVVIDAGDTTRTNDYQTRDEIARRFRNGLRIWKTSPVFDWSLANATV